MITSWKDLWEFIIASKFNSFEIVSTQSPQKSVRKIILNAKIVKNAIAFGALRQALSTGWYLLTLCYNCFYVAKSWNFFLNYQILDLLGVRHYKIHLITEIESKVY